MHPRVFSVLFLLSTSVLVTGSVLLAVCIPYTNINNYLFALKDKHQIFRDNKAPRVIFVGGSNLAFGLDSSLIEKEIGMPVINMGLHVGLGLRYMLNEVRYEVLPGDVVVIVPEYVHFYENGSGYGKKHLLYVLFDIHPAGKKYISLQHWLKIIPFLPTYVKEKFAFMRRSIKNELFSIIGKPKVEVEELYLREGFNERGDFISHLDRSGKFLSEEEPVAKVQIIDERIFVFIKNFYSDVVAKGGRVCLMYPAVSQTLFKQDQNNINVVQEKWSELGIPILGQPQDFVFLDEEMFDTDYHLGSNARDTRSRRVALMLNSFLRSIK